MHDCREAPSLEAVAGYWPNEMNLADRGGEPERLRAVAVTDQIFSTLQVAPVAGRLFTSAEHAADYPRAALLSYELWQRRYGGDPAILGRTLSINADPYEVVGILPARLGFASGADVWTPLGDNGRRHQPRYLEIVARRRPSASITEVRSELETIAARVAAADPGSSRGWGVIVEAYDASLLGQSRHALLLLFGAATLLLLTGCSNVASLLLAQSEGRRRELASRAALGATARRLAGQLLTESLLLVSIATVTGVGLAALVLRIIRLIGPAALPRLDDVTLDGTVLAFAAGLALVTGVAVALAPLLRLRRDDLVEALLSGSYTSTTSRSAERVRRVLVVAQVALSVTLVVGASLLLRSLARLASVDPGFRSEQVVALDVALPVGKYRESVRVVQFVDRLLTELTPIPGLDAVATTTSLPLQKDKDYRLGVSIAGQPAPANAEERTAWYRMVSPAFFQVMRVPLLAGRLFDGRDRADSAPVVIVNRSFAQRFLGGRDPVGATVDGITGGFGPLGNINVKQPTIIGVVGDVKQAGLAADSEPAIYYVAGQAPFRNLTLVVRTSRTSNEVATDVRTVLARLDSDMPIARVRTLDEQRATALAEPRFRTFVLAAFAALTLVSGAVGLYGVLAYGVMRRRRELAIRLALGGDGTTLMRLVVGEGLGLTVAGVAIGLAGAAVLARLVASFLYGVTPFDPLVFAGVPLLLVGVAIVASAWPARVASRLDPARVLRDA